MDTDEVWTTILNEALHRAPCSDEGSTCHLTLRYLPWYATFQHLDYAGHACGVCNPLAIPSYILTVESLMRMAHEMVVARLALWLSHLHNHPTLSGSAGLTPGTDSDPCDGDAPAASAAVASCTSGASDRGQADPATL